MNFSKKAYSLRFLGVVHGVVFTALLLGLFSFFLYHLVLGLYNLGPENTPETLFGLTPVIVGSLILFILAGAFLQLFFVNQALKPLDAMLWDIQKLSTMDKALRLEVSLGAPKEIQTLSRDFNGLLTRVEETFQNQKHFFQDLSHQLRTPLAVMKGEIELGLKRQRPLEEYRSILKSSLEEVERMTAVVDGLLTLARYEARDNLPAKRDVDLGVLLIKSLVGLDKIAVFKNLDLQITLPEAPVYQGVYQDILSRAFRNLGENAVKYANPHTQVRIKLIKKDQQIMVSFFNFGKIINPEEMEPLFDRFFTGKEAGKEKGFGLGLPQAKAAAQLHNGHITVESSKEAGTTFVMTWEFSESTGGES